MQRESMGGDGITGTASEAANKAFSQAMSSYTGMATTSMPYSGASSAGALHHPHTPTSQSQSSGQLAYQHQQQQLMNSAAAVMNAGAITCLVCYNAQVNIMLEPCRHQFHVHCIDRWLNKDKVCPICWIPIQSHRPIVSPYANPAVSTPGGSGSSPTSGGGGYGNGSAPNGNGTATGSGSGSHGGGMLSQPAATSILPAQAAANMEHPNPPSMRKGKWTAEESSYCDRLIEEFKKGNLPLAEGTTLRTFLSKLLNCDPMRISKKYTGDQCIGKIIFRRREDELTKDEMESIRRDLAELEKTYLEREQYNQRRREKRLESELSRDKNRFMAAARSGNGNGNINVAVAAGGANANANGMAAFNAAAVAVAANAMRPPPPPQSMGGQQGYPPPGPSPSGQQQAPSPHHHHQQQQQQQHQQQQQAYQNQLAAQQQRQQMIAAVQAQAAQAQAQAQAQAHRSAQQQAQSLAPPPRHPPAQHAYNGPPSRLKDEFPSEPPASSAMADASTSSNAQSMSRVSSIDSFGCLFPRVASVDGFGSATNLASYGASSSISSMSTTTATSDAIVDHTGGLVKSISIGDGLSAYFPRIQSLEHLSSLLQEHAPTSPTRGGTGAAANGQLPRQLNITVKSESQPSHRNEEDGEGEGGDDDHEQLPPREGVEQLRDADVSKRLSPVHQPGHLHKHSTLADYANQIQAPKPLTNKMPRSSSGIFPRVASMDKLPRVPSMDKLPRIPSMDKLSAGMDGTIPRAPSMGKLPRVPSLDKHLSRVSSNSDMMSRFGSSDHLSSFPSFSNLTGLSSSMSYDKLSSLGGGVGSAVGGGGGPHGGTFRGGSFPRNSSIEDILSLVASSESGGLSSNNSSLQLSALAALAGEESAANDRKRRLEQAHSHAGHATTSTASSASSDGAESSKKSRVSA